MILFTNANFHSLNKNNDVFGALLIDNGVIKQTFKHSLSVMDVQKIDLQGKHVYPGFIDTHTHSFEGGLYSLGTDMGKVESIAEALTLLSQAKPFGNCLFAFNYDENRIKEKRFPLITELDRICSDIPLILRRVDGHSCVINSKAAALIPWKTKLPSDFDGLLRKEENDFVAHWFHKHIDAEHILEIYHHSADLAAKSGHTTIHTMIGDAQNDYLHYKIVRDNLTQFKIDFILYPQIFSITKALELGASRIGGCILADGSFGSHTAALFEPYIDQPDCIGTLYKSDSFWQDFVQTANHNNLAVAVHCLGDRAVSQIVRSYQKVLEEDNRGIRHQIIHGELISSKTQDIMQKYNISASMQPMFDHLWGGDKQYYAQVLGIERALKSNRFATLTEKGINVCGSSDWYITELSALKGINSAMHHHNPEERLTLEQALHLYTKNAAWLSGHEQVKGCLDIGFDADLTCLNQEISPDTDIAQIKIDKVFKRGKQIAGN